MLLNLSIIWAVLATVVLGLGIFRKFTSREEDDTLHLNSIKATSRQVVLADSLGAIDRWGVTLTAIVLVYGLGLVAAFLYSGWLAGQEINLK